MKNLEIIAFSIDLARQKERVEFVKNQMKFCRANGYNTVLLYLEASVRTSVTAFFDEASSYSLDEIADIVNYGESIGIDVVPAFETLAHMEKFFVYDNLADLAEFDDEHNQGRDFCSLLYPHGSHGCATNPRLQSFTDKYVTEVCGVFHSKYVHMGMDEMFQFACCDDCRRTIEGGVTKQQLFVDFVLHAHALVSAMNRTMLIWDDMLEYYPVAGLLPRDIVLCNWNYIYVGVSPRGKWTGRSGVDPFALYDKLGFRYMFCSKAGNLSQTFNVDSYTEYAEKHNPLGAILTSWERSDCFYPCLQPVVAYAGRLWSGMTDGKTAVEVFAEYIGDGDLSERLVNLFAPDFVFCRTDIVKVAEENNHVISAYIARLNATLQAFERYKSAHNDEDNDVFDDLYANLALQYSQLSLSTLGNKVFDEYECGGVVMAQPYLVAIERAETLFDLAQNTGSKLYAKYRGGITSYGNAWQRLCEGNKQLVADLRKDLNSVVGQKRGVLRLRLMLPDTYASIRAEVFVRYVGQREDTLLQRGSTKTMLTMFDVSGEYVLRFATEPQPIEYVLFAAYGEGAQYPVYAEHFDGKSWHAPVAAKAASGVVKDEQNILQNNANFCVLGTDDGRAHLGDMSLGKQRNAIRIVF